MDRNGSLEEPTRAEVERTNIVKTIPKRKLADTGGASLIVPAGALLLSTGLLLGRSVIRRAL
jgi:hypothetical protein